MRSLWRIPNTFCLLLAGLLLVSCAPEPAQTWLTSLDQGVFLPSAPFFHPATLNAERNEQAWWAPHSRPILISSGWGELEDWGVWGTDEATQVLFLLDKAGAESTLDFVIRARAADPKRAQDVSLLLNGESFGDFTADADWQDHRLPIPAGRLQPGENVLELRYSYNVAPTEDDHRRRALAFEGLGLVPTGEDPVWGPGFRVDTDRDALLMAASGTYTVLVEVPENAKALILEPSPTGRAEQTLRAGILTLDGTEEVLFDGPAVGEEVRLPLDGHQGRRVVFFFEAKGGGRLALGQPRLVLGKPASNETRETPTQPAQTQEKPNVVILVLDAARADHFSTYGYKRETSPEIDAIAAESLVFEQVIAECSYTMCSMPSLLAGLSFPDHGLVERPLALRDDVVTLAEALKENGYNAFGATANPNSSQITGLDQGFDNMLQDWNPDPLRITRFALRRLRQGQIEPPLFMMLHFVPPHEPYAPRPRHDIFGDPNYDGFVTGDRLETQAIYDRLVEVNDEDLAEIVALYDGNLRAGDEAVGRIIRFFKTSGLWDNTFFVITSDHGEAFMEHGEIGHNRNVFEEMMWVPLIIKPPKGTDLSGVDTKRLATLADVVTTIYNHLGIEPPQTVRGNDLFAPAGDVLVPLRSAQEVPHFGIRTTRYKAIARQGELPLFLDLQKDPKETRNALADDRRALLLHGALIAHLKTSLDDPNAQRAGARAEPLKPKDIEMLKTLGYL